MTRFTPIPLARLGEYDLIAVDEAAARAASTDADCAPCSAAATARGWSDGVQERVNALVAAGGPAAQWSGPIGFENRATGDGRLIETNALTWSAPVPLLWAPENNGGHLGAQVVGWINSITRGENGAIIGEGAFDLGSEVGREAFRQVQEGLTPGISMDLDDISFEIRVKADLLESNVEVMQPEGFDPVTGEPIWPDREENRTDENGYVTVVSMSSDDEMMVTTAARIRAATLVATPAFADALISLKEPEAGLSLVASVIGSTTLPVASRDRAWDGGAAMNRVFDFYTDGDTVDTEGVARAFLYRDPDADPTTKGAYSLGFADVIDGELRIVPRGVAATAGGRGVDAASIPDAEKTRIKSRVCSLYDQVRNEFDDWPTCPFEADGSNSLRASAATVTAPPRRAFEAPDLSGPTPLTVSDTGRVFGHIATWDTCHIGYPGQCVTPPPSPSGYAFFHTGAIVADDGSEVAVGHLTIDTGHADAALRSPEALAHYDNTGTAVAYVRAGEDAFGIWVAGVVRPDATPEQVRALRASPISGDWRRIGAGMELVAALGVNVPGFPVPRTRALVAGGAMQTLVAAGMLAPREVIAPGTPGALSLDDLRYLKRLANVERERERAAAPASDERLAEAAAMAKRVRVLAFASSLGLAS